MKTTRRGFFSGIRNTIVADGTSAYIGTKLIKENVDENTENVDIQIDPTEGPDKEFVELTYSDIFKHYNIKCDDIDTETFRILDEIPEDDVGWDEDVWEEKRELYENHLNECEKKGVDSFKIPCLSVDLIRYALQKSGDGLAEYKENYHDDYKRNHEKFSQESIKEGALEFHDYIIRIVLYADYLEGAGAREVECNKKDNDIINNIDVETKKIFLSLIDAVNDGHGDIILEAFEKGLSLDESVICLVGAGVVIDGDFSSNKENKEEINMSAEIVNINHAGGMVRCNKDDGILKDIITGLIRKYKKVNSENNDKDLEGVDMDEVWK